MPDNRAFRRGRRTDPSGDWTANDERFMRQALELARQGTALASPNPRVGAVVVSGGRVVGCGSHDYAGRLHAEVKAIQEAGVQARGSTLYLNLEPCSHTGRTPPCASAIIAAGVARVVAAMGDPNPRVNGAGFAALRNAGIEVAVGCLAADAQRLNEAFVKWIRHGVPFVLMKAAVSLDGKIARRVGPAVRPDWLSGEAARAEVQQLRHESDAILAGLGTVLADDPLLTDRTELPRRRPLLRVVLDTQLRLPLTSRLVTTADDDVVVFCGDDADAERRAALEDHGVRVCPVARGAHGVELAAVLQQLGDADITSLLVEGGSRVHSSLVAGRLADKLTLYVAPTLIGSCGSVPLLAPRIGDASGDAPEVRLQNLSARQLGADLVIEGYFEYGAKSNE